MPTETTDDNAMSGLAILFAAIDYTYHQSTLPTCFSTAPKTHASPNDDNCSLSTNHSMDTMAESAAAMVGSTPEQDNGADFKWIDSVKKRKMNKKTRKIKKSKKSKKRSTKNKKPSTTMSVSIQAPDAAESYDISAVVSPASSFENSPAALDDRLSSDDELVETYPKKRMRCEGEFLAIPDQPKAKHVCIDLDGLAARIEQQQQRLFEVSQQTKRSRAELHMMRYDLMRIAES